MKATLTSWSYIIDHTRFIINLSDHMFTELGKVSVDVVRYGHTEMLLVSVVVGVVVMAPMQQPYSQFDLELLV